MKFVTQTIFALAVGIISSVAVASPLLAKEVPTSTIRAVPPRMQVSDRFSESGLDYMTWANKQVADGKMYWPNETTTTSSIVPRVSSYSLTDIACGYIEGTEAEYLEGQQKYCSYVQKFNSGLLLVVEYILQKGVCGHRGCTLIAEMTFDVGGGLYLDGLTTVCVEIWDQIASKCPGHTGGSGKLSLTDRAGTQPGTVQFQFYEKDDGAKCPANDDTRKCKSSLF